MITILLNVNLAIFNLLPLPVLDGGQMLFATVARLRGRTCRSSEHHRRFDGDRSVQSTRRLTSNIPSIDGAGYRTVTGLVV